MLFRSLKIENVPAQVYLTDLKLNQSQNLNENPVYSFTASAGDDPARFLLSFSHVGTGETPATTVGIYSNGNNIYLVNPGKARLEVFSLSGQKVNEQEINCQGLYKTGLSCPTGYYIVRVVTATAVSNSKIFIQE